MGDLNVHIDRLVLPSRNITEEVVAATLRAQDATFPLNDQTLTAIASALTRTLTESGHITEAFRKLP